MKICPKCGAIWENDRNTCLDCDTVLPNALSTLRYRCFYN